MSHAAVQPALHFALDARHPGHRELLVELELDLPQLQLAADEVLLALPAWTPGSYLIREYARQLSAVRAADADSGAALECRKTSKNRYAVYPQATTRRIRLQYSVYAHELSVRTADLTARHAYWNHACVLLWPVAAATQPARLSVLHPRGWQVACALPRIDDAGTTTPWPEAMPPSLATRTELWARDLDHAIDSPCLVGEFQQLRFEVHGVLHAVVLDGLDGVTAPANLTKDLAAIVGAAAAMFGQRLPYPAYLFLCLFSGDGYGGLEHAESTTLLFGRSNLATAKGYREFLALAAHELFHAWNGKRMRPAEFWRYDYEQENYTSLLWLIEGWTAYYDDLLCRRAGVFTPAEYLEAVGSNIAALRNNPGRFRLSLAESSFDAWIRLYRPDENTRNSSQNYYGNGAVAALCLDLWLRRATDGQRSLDDVVQHLFELSFGADRGYVYADVEAAIRSCLAASEQQEATLAQLRQWTGGSLDPELEELLGSFGLQLKVEDAGKPFLGVTFRAGSMVLAAVASDGPGHRDGLNPDDEILAVQGLRVDTGKWQEIFQSVARIDQPLEVLLSRRGVVERLVVTPCASPGTVKLCPVDSAPAAAVALRRQWLAIHEA